MPSAVQNEGLEQIANHGPSPASSDRLPGSAAVPRQLQGIPAVIPMDAAVRIMSGLQSSARIAAEIPVTPTDHSGGENPVPSVRTLCPQSARQAPASTQPINPDLVSNATSTEHEHSRNEIRADIAAGKLTIPEYGGTTAVTAGLPAVKINYINFTPHQNLRFRQQFGPSIISPNKDLSFKVQVLENVRQWVFLAATVTDDTLRADILTRVFNKYEKIWFEALRLGYNAGDETAPEVGAQAPHDAGNRQSGGQKPRTHKSRKRELPPSAVPVFVPEKFKNVHGYAFPLTPITAGELEEAGLSEDQVRDRAASCGPASVNVVFSRFYDKLEGAVNIQDWKMTEPTTDLNPAGRNLFLYSLYVVQLYERNLTQLRRFQSNFKTGSQLKNGQRNIDKAEQDRRVFLALALELNDLHADMSGVSSCDNQNDDQEDDTTEVGGDANEIDKQSTDTIDQLLKAIDMVLEEPEPSNLCRAFEASGYSEAALVMTMAVQNGASPTERCKATLGTVLAISRERHSVMEELNLAHEENAQRCCEEKVRSLETNLREQMGLLRSLVPCLLQNSGNEEVDSQQENSEDAPLSHLTGRDATEQDHVTENVGSSIADAQTPDSIAGNKRTLDNNGVECDSEPVKKKQKLQDETQVVSNASDDFEKNDGPRDVEDELDDANVVLKDTEKPGSSERLTDEQAQGALEGQEALEHPAASFPEPPLSKKERYTQNHLLPLANQLLQSHGQPPMPGVVRDFSLVKDWLRNADIPVIERNKVVAEYNKGLFNDWTINTGASPKDAEQALSMADIPMQMTEVDQPTASQAIESAIPTTQPQETVQRRSLIVKLAINPKYQYDPAQYSCNTLLHHKGYRFRYTRESTLAERNLAMDPIDNFVRARTSKRSNQYPRYGRYEAICLASDPSRKTIVHGYWDLQDKTQAPGSEWFFNDNKDHADPAANDSEASTDQSEDDAELPVPLEPCTTPKRPKKVTFAPLAASRNSSAAPSRSQETSNEKSKSKPSLRLNLKANARNTNSTALRRQKETGKGTVKKSKNGAAMNKRGRFRRASAPDRECDVGDVMGDGSDRDYVPDAFD